MMPKSMGWLIVLAWFMFGIYLPGIDGFLHMFGYSLPFYWWDLLYFSYGYFLFFVAIIFASSYGHISWQKFFEAKMNTSSFIPSIKLTLFFFIFSIGAAYLLFYPLSFAFPDFVDYWYINDSDIIYYQDDHFPIMANLVSFSLLVIVPPILEELAFRGVLLQSWSAKWGFWKAAFMSSFIFGIVHSDPIGAIAFGLGMCYLYARFKNLLIPIICHALNNFAVWLLVLYDNITLDSEIPYTLAQFQSEWYIGLICLIISLAWASKYYNASYISHLKDLKYPI